MVAPGPLIGWRAPLVGPDWPRVGPIRCRSQTENLSDDDRGEGRALRLVAEVVAGGLVLVAWRVEFVKVVAAGSV